MNYLRILVWKNGDARKNGAIALFKDDADLIRWGTKKWPDDTNFETVDDVRWHWMESEACHCDILDAQDLLDLTSTKGSIGFSPGVSLNTQESITSDQKSWDDNDSVKKMDFSTSPYWLVADTSDVIGIDSASDLEKYL